MASGREMTCGGTPAAARARSAPRGGAACPVARWHWASGRSAAWSSGSTWTVSGVTVYGSLGAAIAVLAWLYVTALAVLIGAALNAEIDKLWPGEYMARARAEAAEAQTRAAEEHLEVAESRAAAVESEGSRVPLPRPESSGSTPADGPEHTDASIAAPARGRQARGAGRARRPTGQGELIPPRSPERVFEARGFMGR